ncbi:uncharacterized protein LOC106644346 [Copidosoma floridanum]|uniref:uncharacterized protein LOC106644346 n=1 Tax=Copidosoma floridanum TaxID=29053 RepID=UPI0006C99FD1|nr:uncharacterized protein LOC106644346 [Copidosoma floridanum]
MSGRGRGFSLGSEGTPRASDQKAGRSAPTLQESAAALAAAELRRTAPPAPNALQAEEPSKRAPTDTQKPAGPEPRTEQSEHWEDAEESPAAVMAANPRNMLQRFWRDEPELWFMQAEEIFSANKVTDDALKYGAVYSALDKETLRDLVDLLKNKPETDRYDFLKASLMKRLAESKEVALRRLLTNVELGDSTPSQLWRKMKALAGEADDGLVKALWLSKLPCHTQTLLQAFKSATTPVEELTEAADSLVSSAVQINAVSSNDAIARQLQQSNVLMSQMLTAIKACLPRTNNNNNNNNSNAGRRNNRARSRSRSRTRQQEVNKDYCWYHNKFGSKARSCQAPCSFPQEN